MNANSDDAEVSVSSHHAVRLIGVGAISQFKDGSEGKRSKAVSRQRKNPPIFLMYRFASKPEPFELARQVAIAAVFFKVNLPIPFDADAELLRDVKQICRDFRLRMSADEIHAVRCAHGDKFIDDRKHGAA